MSRDESSEEDAAFKISRLLLLSAPSLTTYGEVAVVEQQKPKALSISNVTRRNNGNENLTNPMMMCEVDG